MDRKIVISISLCIILFTTMSQNLFAKDLSFGVSPLRQQELSYMIRQDCGSCHGMTLKGGLGSPLLAERLSKFPKQFLIETIKHGRPDTAMPPWLPILSEKEIIWIVDWLLKPEPK